MPGSLSAPDTHNRTGNPKNPDCRDRSQPNVSVLSCRALSSHHPRVNSRLPGAPLAIRLNLAALKRHELRGRLLTPQPLAHDRDHAVIALLAPFREPRIRITPAPSRPNDPPLPVAMLACPCERHVTPSVCENKLSHIRTHTVNDNRAY